MRTLIIDLLQNGLGAVPAYMCTILLYELEPENTGKTVFVVISMYTEYESMNICTHVNWSGVELYAPEFFLKGNVPRR